MSFLKAESAAGSVKLWRSLVVRDSKGWREVQVSSNSCCCVQLFSIWPAVCPVTTLAYYETRCCELTENQCFPQNNSLHFPIIACWPANLTGNWKLTFFTCTIAGEYLFSFLRNCPSPDSLTLASGLIAIINFAFHCTHSSFLIGPWE